MLSSEYGEPAVAVLLLQDLAVVPLLAFVSLMATPELTIAEDVFFAFAEAFLILVLILTTARYILNPTLNRLARFSSPEIFTASALLLVLGSAYVMERIGLSMAMGAFSAGLLIADSSYRHQIIAEIQPFRGLLLGLFFMSMGMSLNLTLFFANPLVLLGIMVALIAGKFLILWPLSRVFGIQNTTSVSIALLLAQSGEFALVLFALAKGMGLLDETLFQHLLIIVLLSMLATPALEKAAYRIFSSIRERSTTIPEFEIGRTEQDAKPVLLVGFGRMGRKIGYILDFMKVPFVAIDSNAALVDRERAEGKPVYFGDVKRAEVFRAAGAADAPLVIVAIDDFEVTERVVSTLHAAYPTIPIFARGHDMVKCQNLKALGAHFTASETLEASAELAREALLHMGVEAPEVEVALDDLRKDYYERTNQVRVEIKPGPNIP
jgi:voltage-gated potassium channel Kch